MSEIVHRTGQQGSICGSNDGKGREILLGMAKAPEQQKLAKFMKLHLTAYFSMHVNGTSIVLHLFLILPHLLHPGVSQIPSLGLC